MSSQNHSHSVAEVPPVQSERAYPPPFWWTKRLLLGLLVLVLLLAGLRLAWGWHANRLIDRSLAHYRAAGEPAVLSDLDSPGIPSDDNAVDLLEQAWGYFGGPDTGPSDSVMVWQRDKFPYPPEWQESVERALEAHSERLDLLRKARQIDVVTWETDWTVYPGFGWVRIFNNFVADAALYAHFAGDDHTALETIADALFISRALDQQQTLMSHSVALGLEQSAIYRTQIIATGFRIADAPRDDAPMAIRPADREQVRSLIDYLLDDQRIRKSHLLTLQIEIALLVEEDVEIETKGFVLRPMEELDDIRMLTVVERAMRAAKQPSWHDGHSLIPTSPENIAWWGRGNAVIRVDREFLPRLASARYSDSIRRRHTRLFRAIAERRLAAAALAIRLYHNDHGEYPAELGDLVPEYLPVVPTDPFHPDARPIGYVVAAGGLRPIIYSIGDEGVVDPVEEADIPVRAMYGWQVGDQRHPVTGQWFSPKQWRDVAPWQDPNVPVAPDPDDEP